MSARTTDDAASQLRRLLIAIPTLADDQPHPIADVAALVGVDVDTLARDLRTLVTRFEDGPGGFMEGVRLAFDKNTVQLESTLFRRPMGLTPSELGALELGLAALARELPPHEAAVAERARGRVVEASTGLAPEVARVPALAGTLVTSEQDGLHLSQLRTAIAGHRKVTLQYMSGSSAAGADRSVHPYGLVHARGHWYLIGYCDRAMSIRIFRLDRITDVTVLDAEANIPPNMDLEATLHDGMPLVNSAEEVLRVQYSAAIARWIAEQQAVDAQPDGSVIAEYPLLDDEWAVRHVLQYGPDAEVLEPARIRTMVCERLAAILASA